MNEFHRKMGGIIVEAIAPALIMLLVGSLILFLSEVFFVSIHMTRLRVIFALYVFAIVLISRISIEESMERSFLFGIPLAILVFIAAQRFVTFSGPLAAIGPIIYMSFLALAWWCASKLTWDCTFLDNSNDTSNEGLLQKLGRSKLFSRANSEEESDSEDQTGVQPTPEPEEADPEIFGATDENEDDKRQPDFVQAILKRFQKKRNSPGIWVIYFAIAALPIFGFGQGLIPSGDLAGRRFAFQMFVLFMIGGLGLLLTTSLLALHRYLLRRNASMPNHIAIQWVVTGIIVIFVMLFATWMIPRPYPEYSVTDLTGKNQQLDSSWFSFGDDGVDDGGESSSSNSSDDAQNGETQGKSDKSGGDSGNNSKGKSGKNSQSGKSGESGGSKGNNSKQSKSNQSSKKNSGSKNSSSSKSQNSKQSNSKQSNSKQSNSKQSNSKQSNSKQSNSKQSNSKSNRPQNSRKYENPKGQPSNQNKSPNSKQNQSSKQNSKSNSGKSNSKQNSKNSKSSGDESSNKSDSSKGNSSNQPNRSSDGKSKNKQDGDSTNNQKNDRNENKSDASKRQSNQQNSGRQNSSSSKNQSSKKQNQNRRNSGSTNAPKTPQVSQQFGNVLGGMAVLIKWIFYIAFAVVLIIVCIKYRTQILESIRKLIEEFNNFWANLFNKKRPEELAGEVAREIQKPRKTFAQFKNPYASGSAPKMKTESLVAYSFEALEAWAGDRGCERNVDQTPSEFAVIIGTRQPKLKKGVRNLGTLYSQILYGKEKNISPPHDQLQTLWSLLESVPDLPRRHSEIDMLVG